MKVVHLSTIDEGGAYIATKRISEAMQLYGVDSQILVRTRIHSNDNVEEVINTPMHKLLSKTKNVANLIMSNKDINTDIFGTNVSKNPYVKDADVIFLHWVNSFISTNGVKQLLALGKPIIWVAHDMWIITGGCHYDNFCGGYTNECLKCPIVQKSLLYGKRPHLNLKRRCNILKNAKVQIVGPGEWITNCIKQSTIKTAYEPIWIPNPIDYQVFHPISNKKTIKQRWKLPLDKKIILFGADQATANETKGFDYLLKALEKLPENGWQIIIFGSSIPQKNLKKYNPIYLGYVKSEQSMVELYNAADVFVAPSLQETFCYTVGEALACGTPVAAFCTGGIEDQIKHKSNGYLARLKDVDDLATGIMYCIENQMTTSEAKNAFECIGEKYVGLAMKLLSA